MTENKQQAYAPTPEVQVQATEDSLSYCLKPVPGLIEADVYGESDSEAEQRARFYAASVNSYAKHCGPDAIQCAEDDLLGRALEELARRWSVLDDIKMDAGTGGGGLNQDEHNEWCRLRSILARLPQQPTP